MAMLGTPNNLAIWDKTNDECMPQLLNGTGAAQWGDVENHPWTTGMQLDYFTEASLWATWLAKEHPDVTSVAEITYNNDFGQSYHNGFAYAIKGSNIKVVDQETHEATSPNLTNQFTTMAATNAQVAADRDDRRVLHAGDGRGREADGVEPDRDHVRRRAPR